MCIRDRAAALKQKAEADIAQERKKAVNEVKDEIGGIAMEIASKAVSYTHLPSRRVWKYAEPEHQCVGYYFPQQL